MDKLIGKGRQNIQDTCRRPVQLDTPYTSTVFMTTYTWQCNVIMQQFVFSPFCDAMASACQHSMPGLPEAMSSAHARSKANGTESSKCSRDFSSGFCGGEIIWFQFARKSHDGQSLANLVRLWKQQRETCKIHILLASRRSSAVKVLLRCFASRQHP